MALAKCITTALLFLGFLVMLSGVESATTEAYEDVTLDDEDYDATTEDTTITCAECSGQNCTADFDSDYATTCTSTNGYCWFTIDISNTSDPVVTRGCEAAVEDGNCAADNTYPKGFYGADLCQFCCSTGNCNEQNVTSIICQSLQGVSARMVVNTILLGASLFISNASGLNWVI